MSKDTLSRFILLPELKLLRSFRLGKAGIGFLCEKTSEFEVCPKCATPSCSIYDHRPVKIKDEPIRNKIAVLFINKRRFRCRYCKKPFTEPVSGISKGKRTTQRFASGVLWASENYSDLKKVQKNFRCSADTIYRSTFSQLELNLKKRSYPLPEDIGMDERAPRMRKRRI